MKSGDLIKHDGETWIVIGVGNTDENGRVFLHLASTTKFVSQKNGKRPIQICDWVGGA